MTVAAGSRIGPYEIVAPLGAGGMGEVWRARDPRLGRDVAIKALPESLAHDPERVARFEREARLLASLNHPNVGGIHGLEEAGGHRYLILEFIEGQTLADRLRGRALPLREAMQVCRAIAAALEAAHESGVIHRDLKPGNVMIRADGEVKVLDFGLAKGAAAGASGDAGLSASPTLTYAATSAGVVLGTAAYMSPEQARGKAVDRRTDIWSFGCVLFECLTGRQTFEGETVSDVIARILEREPDWSALPAATPPAVRELLQRCLDKDPKQRLRDIGDARLTLDRELTGLTSGASGAVRAAPAPAARLPLGRTLGLVAAMVAAYSAALWVSHRGEPRIAGGLTHLSIALPDDPKILDGVSSEDGSVMVMAGVPAAEESRGQGAIRLYVRRPDDFELHELPGTQGALSMRISRDGRSVYFRAPLQAGARDQRLARVPIDGSVPPVTVTAWNPDWNSFALLPSGDALALERRGGRVFRISAHDGTVKESAVQRGNVRFASLALGRPLPGGRAVFVTGGVYHDNGWSIETGVLDLAHDRIVMPGIHGGNAVCLPDGTLLYSLGQVLLAVPFDPGKFALRGTPVAVATGLFADFSYTPGQFSVSDQGTLLFLPGGEAGNGRRLGIVDPAGKLSVLPADPHPYQGWPTASRDGRTIAVRVTNAQGIDEIWVGSRDRATLRRLVSWPKADCTSLFLSGDGRTLAYVRVGRDADDGIWLVDVDGAGPGRRILKPDSSTVELRNNGWSPDGRYIVVRRTAGAAGGDLLLAELSAARDSVISLRPLVQGEGDQDASDFSDDGRWLAWQGDETGRSEIYVAPFAGGTLGRPTRLTEQGGMVPEWLPGGRLACRDLAGRRELVLDLGPDPAAGVRASREWFDYETLKINDSGMLHDGSAMVILKGPNETSARAVNLVFGWTRELKKKLARAR